MADQYQNLPDQSAVAGARKSAVATAQAPLLSSLYAAGAQNVQGEWFEMAGEELLARAFCHEIDHLNGRLYISHVSALKRDLIRRKVRKLAKAGEWS